MSERHDALQREAEQILRDGGAGETVVRRDAAGWLVRGRFGSTTHVGHTGIDPATSSDPRDMAHRLVAIAQGEMHGHGSVREPLALLSDRTDDTGGVGGVAADRAWPDDMVGGDQGAESADDQFAGLEDEGQPAASEIFTEEDVEALGAVAVEGEASEDAADDAGSAENASSPPVEDTANVSEDRQPAYPGVALLPDELGARRNAVLAAITTEKLTRLSIAMDPSRADFLAGEATRYWNWPKDVPFPPELERNYADFCMHRDWREKIIAFALSLEASALTADMIQLENMARDLGSGWPT